MERNYFRITFNILSPLLIIGIAFLNGAPNNSRMFMNGELAVKHASLESKCAVCHVPWKEVTNELCVKCHYDDEHHVKYINPVRKPGGERLFSNWVKNLTGINEQPVTLMKCFDCHKEHRGKLYNLRKGESPPESPF